MWEKVGRGQGAGSYPFPFTLSPHAQPTTKSLPFYLLNISQLISSSLHPSSPALDQAFVAFHLDTCVSLPLSPPPHLPS